MLVIVCKRLSSSVCVCVCVLARKALLNLSCSTSVATEEEWESLILSYMMKAIPLLGVCYLITQEMRLLRVCVLGACAYVCVRMCA